MRNRGAQPEFINYKKAPGNACLSSETDSVCVERRGCQKLANLHLIVSTIQLQTSDKSYLGQIRPFWVQIGQIRPYSPLRDRKKGPKMAFFFLSKKQQLRGTVRARARGEPIYVVPTPSPHTWVWGPTPCLLLCTLKKVGTGATWTNPRPHL